MSGFFGSLFGGKDTRSAIINGVDSVVYTTQEKAAQHAKYLELYAPFKLAQRVVATIYTVVFSSAWVVVFFCQFFGVDVSDKSYEMLEGKMGTIASLIVAFYFAGGVVDSLKRK
jgi:hypothetical protein